MIEPRTLTMADEVPAPIVPVPHWSENYAFYSYDYDSGTGFVACVGRWVKNPRLWREQLYVFLPDGSTLSHRSIGTPAGGDTLSGGSVVFKCLKAGETWQIAFEGAMQHLSYEQARYEPVLEQAPHPVSLSIHIDHDFPVLMMHPTSNTNVGKYHYEQMGRSSGSLIYAGKTHRIEGYGYRDHTRGPRQLGSFDSHVWLQLRMPGGGAFSAYHAWANVDGKLSQILDETVSLHSDRFEHAQLNGVVRLASLDALQDPVDATVTMDGRTYSMSGSPITTLLYSLTPDVDFFFGCQPSRALFSAFDQPILFDCEGKKIFGYLQRTIRNGGQHL